MIFISKNNKKGTLNAFVIELLIFLKLGLVSGNKHFNRWLKWKDLDFPDIDGLESGVEIVNLAGEVLLVLVCIGVVCVENEVRNFLLLLLFPLDLLLEDVFELFVFGFGVEEVVPIWVAFVWTETGDQRGVAGLEVL